jgi:hypothetical protein
MNKQAAAVLGCIGRGKAANPLAARRTLRAKVNRVSA